MVEAILRDDIAIKDMEKRHAPAFYEFVEKGRARFLPWIPFVGRTKDKGDIERLIKTFQEKRANGEGFMWGLWKGDRVVGMILVREIDEAARWAEIGYMIAEDFEGRGLVKFACQRLIDFLFGELELSKIVICCDDRNERSIALAEKLGFVLEGNLKRHFVVNGETRNLMHFGLLKEASR